MSADVSVIMTVRNAGPYIAEAIESVRAQDTRLSWELIIIEDGSSDDSCRIAREYADREPDRIRLFGHPDGENRGISASRNRGMEEASADVLAFLDADDVWLPHRLEHQFHILAATPEAAMIYGQAERWLDFEYSYDEVYGSRGRNFVPPPIPAGAQPGLLPPPTLLKWFLDDESMAPCTCTVLVRTANARQVGGFESSFRGLYDDQVFYAKIALREPILCDLRCVARYRRHSESCCAKATLQGNHSRMRDTFLEWLSMRSAESRDASWQ